MQLFKKSVSILLSMIMVFSVFAVVPMTASAKSPGDSGGGVDIGGGGAIIISPGNDENTWTTPPTAKENLVYNGSPQELINGGTPSQGDAVTAKYHLGENESTWKNWSSAIPTATDAGTYTVWYAIDGGGNFTDFEPQSLSVTISPSYTVNWVSENDAPEADIRAAVDGLIEANSERIFNEVKADIEANGLWFITSLHYVAIRSYILDNYYSGSTTDEVEYMMNKIIALEDSPSIAATAAANAEDLWDDVKDTIVDKLLDSHDLLTASDVETLTPLAGTVTLETDSSVASGAAPTYNGPTPTKASDDIYNYTFSGWTDGTTSYGLNDTLPVVSGNVTYTATFSKKAKQAFIGHSVTLGGDIGVNFFVAPEALDVDIDSCYSAHVTFEWEDQNVDVDLGDITPDANGWYKATCNVVAAHMAHTIHAELYIDGTLRATDAYTVQEYAEALIANPSKYDDKGRPDELKALAEELLNYGAMAQTVFASALIETPELANKNVRKSDYSGVTVSAVQTAIENANEGNSADNLSWIAPDFGANFYTSSLIYLSKNTLRLYFTKANFNFEYYMFDGNVSDYYYYVQVQNISAKDLDTLQEFSVGGYDFRFSALDYVKAVLNSSMTDVQKNLAKSLFLYNQAANAYLE